MKHKIFNDLYNKYSKEIELINSEFPKTTYRGKFFVEEDTFGNITEVKYIETSPFWSQNTAGFCGNNIFIRFREDGIYEVENYWQSDDYGNISVEDDTETEIKDLIDWLKVWGRLD